MIVDNQNKGIASRLNEQISMAQGKYFVRMDADDLMFSDRILNQLNFLENNPTLDLVGSSAVVIDENNIIRGMRTSAVPKNDLGYLLKNPFIHPTIMGKTIWFRNYLYSESFSGVEDMELWIRSHRNSTFHVTSEPLLFYRDPSQFNLNTYRFRIFKSIKLLNSLKRPYPLNYQLRLVKMFMILKLITFTLLKYMKLSSFIVKRRNVLCEKKNEIIYYKEIHNYI